MAPLSQQMENFFSESTDQGPTLIEVALTRGASQLLRTYGQCRSGAIYDIFGCPLESPQRARLSAVSLRGASLNSQCEDFVCIFRNGDSLEGGDD